jgi:hypothetical protein
MRVHAAVAAMLILLAGAVADAVLREKLGTPRGAVALPLLVPLIWMVFVGPGRRWRAWGYAMDADELQVARGIWTQVHTVVPLDRVQHIDISQGPVERGCGVCRLVVHTAGTLHSQVVLPGLSRPTAERMRDEIRARIRQEEA